MKNPDFLYLSRIKGLMIVFLQKNDAMPLGILEMINLFSPLTETKIA